jgi:predicted dehydrogenase
MCGYNRRFSPLAVTLRGVFAGRREPLAMVYRVNAGAIAASEWVQDPRVGGGRVVGECGHFVDFLSFVSGSPPVAVSASAIDGKSDVVTFTLEFANGSIGTVHYFANGNPGLPKEHIEVFGGGIAAQLFNFRRLKVAGARASGPTRVFGQAKGFAEEAAAVIAAVRSGQPAPIPFADLCLTSRVTFGVQRALANGGRIVL